MSKQQLSALSVTFENDYPLAIVQFSRPDKLNSFIPELYHELTTTLTQLDSNDKVSVVLLTGSGSYYSTGHDISSQIKETKQDQSQGTDMKGLAFQMVARLIDFSKPIIVAVNGPAFGIAVTMLALCDIIYASDTATFVTPFMQFGFCAEGCSSILFPQIMGVSKANELLLLGKKMSAQEAERANFVSAVFPANSLLDEALKRARVMSTFPPTALRDTKELSRASLKQLLHEVNDRELTCLVKRFMTEESQQAMMKFMMEKQGKKPAKL